MTRSLVVYGISNCTPPPALAIALPNLHNPVLNPSGHSFQSFQRMVDQYIADFSRIPGVKIGLIDLKENASANPLNPEPKARKLTEVGTDGDIDHIPAEFSWEKP